MPSLLISAFEFTRNKRKCPIFENVGLKRTKFYKRSDAVVDQWSQKIPEKEFNV
jgi:hypothetical protein